MGFSRLVILIRRGRDWSFSHILVKTGDVLHKLKGPSMKMNLSAF